MYTIVIYIKRRTWCVYAHMYNMYTNKLPYIQTCTCIYTQICMHRTYFGNLFTAIASKEENRELVEMRFVFHTAWIFSMNNFLIFKKQKQIHDGNLFEMASFILGISMVVASSLNWHQNCQGPTPDRIRYTEWDSYIQLALGSFDQVIYIY